MTLVKWLCGEESANSMDLYKATGIRPETGRALIAPLNLIAGGLRRLRRAECGGKGPNITIGL